MKLNVKTPIAYRLGATEHAFEVGEQDVPDDMAEIAMGAGWASPSESKAAPAPANKARKGAPENK